MKKVEAIVEPDKLTAAKEALMNIGIDCMTISEVHGNGSQKGSNLVYRGQKYSVDLLPKVRFDVVVADERLDDAVDAISSAAHTGNITGDSILVYDIAEAVQIRNGVRTVR